MQLQDILYSQGFGTRRVCAGLVQQGLVQVFAAADDPEPMRCLDATAIFDPIGLRLRVQGVVLGESTRQLGQILLSAWSN